MQLGWVGLADTGLNWKLRILSSIFPWDIFQILDWKYLFCVQQEVFRVFTFPYFVLTWYILAQRLVKMFPKWKYFFSSSILKWHIIVQTETTSYFSKTSILTNSASLVLFFFQELHITCKTYYNLSIKAENYQLD